MNGLEALPFLREKGHVVSLVGGGGKTTLLYGMACLCACLLYTSPSPRDTR